MSAFLKRIFGRDDKGAGAPETEGDHLPAAMVETRIRHAAESILENETLTADLEDAAAKILLDWGVALAHQIAADTKALDDITAEEAMVQPMRALRRMLRAVNQWVSSPDELGLQKIMAQAKIVYGPDFDIANPDQSAQFLDQISPESANAPERIRKLRIFLENQVIP